MRVRRAYHVIPVPRGWSVEQAWEAIGRGDLLTDPDPYWASVYVEDGRFVRVLETRGTSVTDEPESVPRNLTHCATCDKPFPEPMIHWDDYFVELKDAGFVCEDCPEVYE